MNARRVALYMILLLALAACNFPGRGLASTATLRPVVATDTPLVPSSTPAETSAPAMDTRSAPEAIMIIEPGPGSRVTSPLRVSGVADPAFEQTLVARLVDFEGSVLTEEPLMIQSPLGERGPFETEIAFTASGDVNAMLQIYKASARDGGILHLASVGLMLSLDGPQEIVTHEPYPEQIEILEPKNGQQISADVLHVEGIGRASFEGTLVLELYDADGAQLGSQPIVVEAPEMGQPGFFAGDITYSITQPGPARLVVRDPIPVSNGVNHITSVEIRLQP